MFAVEIINIIYVLCLAPTAIADLRMASRPREAYKLRNEGAQIKFASSSDVTTEYMEPSSFEYRGLENQKRKNYDQFLRSNIDNEQDNRDFTENEGRDHLPFRTWNGAVVRQEGIANLPETVNPGASKLVPLRWNNPHASELEVNIWIFPNGHSPVVVPVRKPTCSGEGYQNNVVSFTVPVDFAELGSKIPGFSGCNAATRPMCTVQVYAHSVESRTYATAFPIIIPNHDTSRTTTSTAQILPAANDPGMDLSSLRDLCLPSSDASADIPNAQPRWAKLVSDVYNHAYQNSDFSPYSGQQHEKISKNLQASAINKMITGNRGELGKNALPNEMKNQIKKLQKLEDKIYKTYESLANKIIKKLGNSMKQTGTMKAGGTTQQLANCFRCDQVGSTLTNRQTTNTYIPSFELPAALVADAQKLVPNKYAGLIAVDPQTNKAVVKIYETAMTDLSKLFSDATAYGIIYQPAMVKTTLVTMSDATQFKKRTANNGKDKGEYAAKVAKIAFAKGIGCAETCLKSQTGNNPLMQGSQATSVTGQCAPCKKLFENLAQPATIPVSPLSADLASGGTLPPSGAQTIAPYPDIDGSDRVGRPTVITTTTVRYYAPPPIGVVGSSHHTCLSVGIMVGAVVITFAAFS